LNPAAVLSILVKAQGVSAATGELARLEGAAKAASASTDTMAKKTKGSFTEVNKQSKYAALGVLGVAGAAVKMAADFQSSMNQLQAVSGVSTRELGKLRKEAIKLGADTKLPATSAKDAAEAMTEMIKAGVSLKDTMSGVRGVLVLSAAAGVDNARAAEIASNALNAFKLSGKDVNAVVDQLANTANASSVEINDVADSFNMAAAVFSGFQAPTLGAKKAMTELNVAIGLLGNAGIKGSDAGTSLKQMLLQLTGPSDKAKGAMEALYLVAQGAIVKEGALTDVIQGGKKQREQALNSLVDHNKALAKGGDIAYDAAGKMRSLKDIIALVTAGTKNMTDEQKNAYVTQIFGADATRSVIALMNAGPAAFDKMTDAVVRQGAAQDLADAKMKGFKGSLEAFKGRWWWPHGCPYRTQGCFPCNPRVRGYRGYRCACRCACHCLPAVGCVPKYRQCAGCGGRVRVSDGRRGGHVRYEHGRKRGRSVGFVVVRDYAWLQYRQGCRATVFRRAESDL
jgi:TP901 family phage tail tape measure protein